MRINFQRVRRGDTLIEVLFAITIFSLISISTMVIMNSSTNAIESNLEETIVRAEVDAQADAIRFIHDAYLSEGSYQLQYQSSGSISSSKSQYYALWHGMVDNTLSTGAVQHAGNTDCNTYYEDTSTDSISTANRHSFVLNIRNLVVQPDTNGYITNSNLKKVLVRADDVGTATDAPAFVPASTYSHLVFSESTTNTEDSDSLLSDTSTTVARVEGIWVNVYPQEVSGTKLPEYYDFHVYTCWYGPGRNIASTIGTVLRLYNPDIQKGGAL